MDDLCALQQEECGTEEGVDFERTDFRILDDSEKITISDEDGTNEVTLTAAEWCAKNGRGILCSTEW
jgi:hypothetical protein